MFEKLKNKLGGGIALLAPVAGQTVPITDVADPTFGEEILGRGIGIQPSSGRVVAPVDGTVTQMFDTGHAVTLTSDDGVEVLVHVGLDTITLKGQHYTIHAHSGDVVKAGDVLMEFDLEAIAAAGYDTVTPVVICNSGDFASIQLFTGKTVAELDEIARLKK